eukprot:347180-Chlamydomonas_euryale.AAC.1
MHVASERTPKRMHVASTHACQWWRAQRQDGLQVRARGDELERDKIVDVTVDEVADCLNHPELDVIVNLAHEPKIKDGETAIRRADEVAR